MEPFENMKGKLREEGPLPEGFGWEEMREGIFEKMANIAEPEKEKKRFGYWKLTFFLLGMIATLLLGVVFHFVNNEPQALENKEETIIAISPSSQLVNPIEAGNSLSKQEQLTPKEIANQTLHITENQPADLSNHQKESIRVGPEEKSTADLKTNNKTERKETNRNSPNSAEKLRIIDDENNLRNNNLNSEVAIKIANIKISKQENTSLGFEKVELSTETTPLTAFNNNQKQQQVAESIIKAKNSKPIWVLRTLEKKDFKSLNYHRLPIINLLSLSNPLVVEKREDISRFSIAIGVGLNYWTPNWGNSRGSQERATYEKALVGSTYSMQLDYRLKRQWSLGTGLTHTRYYSKFDYNKTDNYQKVKKNALVEIQINTVTGDSTQLFGDRTIKVNRQRQVVHYNTFQKWSIPLVVKHSLRAQKMEYAFGVGSILTLSTKTVGKTINKEVQDYNSISPIYQSGFEVGALGTFDINYHLSKRYYMGIQFSGIKSLKNWSSENEVDLKPIIFNSQLTLGLKF